MEIAIETNVDKSTRKTVKQDEPYTLDDFIRDECERDPEFREHWIESEPERNLGISLVRARVANEISQSELSKKTGITQGDISRIESARANPSLKTLKRIAKGLGMKVQITFVPVEG